MTRSGFFIGLFRSQALHLLQRDIVFICHFLVSRFTFGIDALDQPLCVGPVLHYTYVPIRLLADKPLLFSLMNIEREYRSTAQY